MKQMADKGKTERISWWFGLFEVAAIQTYKFSFEEEHEA